LRLNFLQTFDALTGKFKQNFCVSNDGTLTDLSIGSNNPLVLGGNGTGVGTIQLNQASGVPKAVIFSNGSWFGASGVPYFRSVDLNAPTPFDVMCNNCSVGTPGQAWIDICATDITLDSSNFECNSIGNWVAATHWSIGSKKSGTGVNLDLGINETGGHVGIGGFGGLGLAQPLRVYTASTDGSGAGSYLRCNTTTNCAFAIETSVGVPVTSWHLAIVAGTGTADSAINDGVFRNVNTSFDFSTNNGTSTVFRLTTTGLCKDSATSTIAAYGCIAMTDLQMVTRSAAVLREIQFPHCSIRSQRLLDAAA